MSDTLTSDLLLPLLNTDPASAIVLIQSDANPFVTADRYSTLIPDLYWKHKNLPAVVLLSQAGIAFAFDAMTRFTTPEQRETLATLAKSLAYNLASFTWIGWDEPGIVITPADSALGLGAAKLSLRLALELHKPADRISDAHWAIGACLLVERDFAAARAEFEQALPGARDIPLIQGYIELARILSNDPAAPTAFATLLTNIAASSDKESHFIHTQLTTAHRVFTTH